MNSTNTSFIFWQKWLVIISCAGILVGFLLPFLSTVDFIAANYIGAVIIAWSICMLFLALYPFKKHEKWSWWCIASSLLITFIVDISFSIHFKFYAEIIVALTWFLGGIIPIIATYKDFFSKSSNEA